MSAMTEIHLHLQGVTAAAKLLDDLAPATITRLRAALPISGLLRHTRVSGNCAELTVPELANNSGRLENQISLLAPSSISYEPGAECLLFSYGEAQARTATGNCWATLVGQVVTNVDEFHAKLRDTRDSGPKEMRIELVEVRG
jgi:hypothetical protein